MIIDILFTSVTRRDAFLTDRQSIAAVHTACGPSTHKPVPMRITDCAKVSVHTLSSKVNLYPDSG